MTTVLRPEARVACLEVLRREYMNDIIARAARAHRSVRITSYVLADSGEERRADLGLIRAHAVTLGWKVAPTTFADLGQPPSLTQRPGFGGACRYATQCYAHGILAIARPALTPDDEAYTHVLEYLYHRGVFLAYLPAVCAGH
ncbi:hypothetical protein ACIRP3_42675 [Streptomyces sp. NPDC101209]|uniref:hypothetical protein n=1 Tax=Streptomyces sp. NPDC101209 TaxID=3366129 RepID=UPI00382FB94D